MKFKANKIIVFCNRRITSLISNNLNNTAFIKSLLTAVNIQAKNKQLGSIDFPAILNYIMYTLGNYYKGNTIFVFQLLVACLYLITPVDIVSDFFPVIGYIDDIMLFTLILNKYQNELNIFKDKNLEPLDIEYMRVDESVFSEFDFEPSYVVDLIIKDEQLVEINGEEIINEKIASSYEVNHEDYLFFESNHIIEYELINLLLKAKQPQVELDVDFVEQLIQVPGVVSKSEIKYFLKNIEEIIGDAINEVTSARNNFLGNKVYQVSFDVDKLDLNTQIEFVQTDISYSKNRSSYIKYETKSNLLTYNHVVEMIDLIDKKHTFDNTFIEFCISIDKCDIIFVYDNMKQQLSYFVTNGHLINIDGQLEVIKNIVLERV